MTRRVIITRTIVLPAATLFLLVVCGGFVSESMQQNMIRGKVRAADGTTVNNAIVELRIGGGGMISQKVTHNDGDFAFNGLASGEYEVAVTVAGFEPAAQTVRFTENDRMNFMEVVSVEIMIRAKPDPNAFLSPPGVSFVQEVPKAARSSYEKGVGKLKEGKPDEGVALLREAIAGFNDYFDAHFSLAKELFRQGKDAEALEELERARQINDRQDAVFFLFGMVMLKQQKFVIAEYAFREALRLNPNNVGSRFYHGVALIEIAGRSKDQTQSVSDLTEAEKELNRAYDMSERKLSAVFYQRARICERRGDNAGAARELENYLKADPDAKNAAQIREKITKLRSRR